jgi:hypothetical protein
MNPFLSLFAKAQEDLNLSLVIRCDKTKYWEIELTYFNGEKTIVVFQDGSDDKDYLGSQAYIELSDFQAHIEQSDLIENDHW